MSIRIPQNIIVESKYTSGNEYIIIDTNIIYKGYYYEMNGKIFAGKEFDINAIELIKLLPKNINPFLLQVSSYVYGKLSNIKLNNTFHFAKNTDAQLAAIYLAPDIIPQGKINSRFSLDVGIKKLIQKNKGELFFNATDLLNTMITKKEIKGQGFIYTSNDYYETQVLRVGYSYKF